MLTNSQRNSYFPLLSHEYSELSQSTICTMTSHQRRRSSVDRASVQSILTPVAQSPAADPPSPHIGVSPNSERFSAAVPSRPVRGHARAQSYAPRRTNRLSLSFPIATGLAPYSTEPTRHVPSSASTTSFPSTPAEPTPVSPSDPAGFLVALASQERKVLELKEELQKAETELTRLKNQWTLRESYKKRGEIRASEPLQPLQPAPTVEPAAGESQETTVAKRQSIEIDKRKALLNNLSIQTKDSRRKFSGAHTRTLSLLSPERANNKQPFPFPPVEESTENSPPKEMPDTSQGITRINSNRNRHSYQGGVTHNAKQIAEDIKAGMWTFLEDIRQATIGDEAAGGTSKASVDPIKVAVKKSSMNSLRNSERRRGQSPRGSPSPKPKDTINGELSLFDAAEKSLSADRARARPKKSLSKQKTSKPISLAAPAIDDLDDGWSNWDSPVPKSPRWSGSTVASEDPPTPSNGRVEEHLIDIHDERTDDLSTPVKATREDLQWPGLDRLTPGNLKRTMSTIMQEWEKSLSPPLEVGKSPLSRANSTHAQSGDFKKRNVPPELKRRSTQEDLLMMSR